MFNTIGFIGTGTMGAAVARAVVKGAPGASILLSNRTPAKAEALAKGLGVQASDNETVARTCSLIFLGVKPQMMAGMLESISPILAARSDRFVLASMAAGLDAQRIQAMAGGKYPVICFMPNTPVAVGAGVVQYYGLGTAQEELDAMLSSGRSAAPVPKGLQLRTLARVRECLAQAPREGCTCEALSEQVGLSSVTVRRYLTYLVGRGEATSRINYDTGGRPSLLYRLSQS